MLQIKSSALFSQKIFERRVMCTFDASAPEMICWNPSPAWRLLRSHTTTAVWFPYTGNLEVRFVLSKYTIQTNFKTIWNLCACLTELCNSPEHTLYILLEWMLGSSLLKAIPNACRAYIRAKSNSAHHFPNGQERSPTQIKSYRVMINYSYHIAPNELEYLFQVLLKNIDK